MKAFLINPQKPEKIGFEQVPLPKIQANQVLIRMYAAALNRRDYWISQGKYPNIVSAILGSDGCGKIVEIGENVDKSFLGKIVLINPNNHWGENPSAQSPNYHILGMPSNGTFAEYITCNVDRTVEKPNFLSFTQAAAIPLAGLTAYRAIFHHGKVQKNQRVLITGIGGGVAVFALQFALALGAEVWVSSSNEQKLAQAQSWGAAGGVNYKDTDWAKKLEKTGAFDLVVDSAGGEAINDFIRLLKPAGKIVFYGATQGLPTKIDLYRMFFKQISLQGSTMGNDEEFVQMIHFIEKHKILPIIDSVRPFADIQSAFEQMGKGNQLGKLVVEM